MKDKLGLDTILILIAIIIVAFFLILAIAGKGKNSLINGNEVSSDLSSMVKKANDADLLKFNSKFKIAEGSSQPGTTVINLISLIEENNITNNDRVIAINGGNDINKDATYSVAFEYGEDGYINAVNIEENEG